MNKILLISIVILCNLLFSQVSLEEGNKSTNDMLKLFEEAFYKLKETYVDSINDAEIIKSGIDGLLRPVDPYTKFMVGSSKQRLEMMTKGKYGGVGMTIDVNIVVF